MGRQEKGDYHRKARETEINKLGRLKGKCYSIFLSLDSHSGKTSVSRGHMGGDAGSANRHDYNIFNDWTGQNYNIIIILFPCLQGLSQYTCTFAVNSQDYLLAT